MKPNIDPRAIVHPDAKIADDVTIGPFTIVHANVQVEQGTYIGSFCELGVETPLAKKTPLRIGAHSVIRSHSLFYESSSFGPGLVTGHRVTVREHTVAGSNLQLGTLCDLQGDCQIGDYVRFHSNVHIGKKSVVGNFVWIFPYVVLTNDPTPPSETLLGVTLEDYAIVATMSVVLPGVRVGAHALVAAGACVGKDVPPHSIAAGVPARILGPTSVVKLKDKPGVEAYPWPRHFQRGYPLEVVRNWREEFGDINEY